MSYILEALKKSEQKRQEGKVPDLRTEPEESRHMTKRRRTWPLALVTVALLATTAALSLWLFAGKNEKPSQEVAPQAVQGRPAVPLPPQATSPVQGPPPLPPLPQMAQKLPPVAPQPPEGQGQQTVPLKLPEMPNPLQAGTTARSLQPGDTVDPVVVPEPPPEEGPAADTAQAKAPAATPAPPPVTVTKHRKPRRPRHPENGEGQGLGTDPRQIIQEHPMEPDVPVEAEGGEGLVEPEEPAEVVEEEPDTEEALQPAEPAEQQASRTAAQPAAGQPQSGSQKKNVLDLLQLPQAVQSRLPEFRVSAHFYSASPPSRLASVNGRVLREGQNLSAGLTLKEITPDGLIFTFENHTFLVSVY